MVLSVTPKITSMDWLHGFAETFPLMVNLITCVLLYVHDCTCIVCLSFVSPVVSFPRFGIVSLLQGVGAEYVEKWGLNVNANKV